MKFIFQPSIFRGKLLVSGRVPPTIFNKAASLKQHMDVYENSGTPKSSILIGFSIINHPFWGTPIFGNTHILQGEFLGFHLPSAESYYQVDNSLKKLARILPFQAPTLSEPRWWLKPLTKTFEKTVHPNFRSKKYTKNLWNIWIIYLIQIISPQKNQEIKKYHNEFFDL